MKHGHTRWILMVCLCLLGEMAVAGPIRDRLQAQAMEESSRSQPVASLPHGMRRVGDVAYGEDPQQRFDVYLPPVAKDAPVIFMVHGGAWRTGDKTAKAVVQNKVARWVPRGFIFISTNYRLLPKADPLLQAQDVARALAVAQFRAASWGGDSSKFVLIGHSAGAHLVALLAAAPAQATGTGVKPWLGAILLDSAALDVERIMNERHARFYDVAFGSEPSYWRRVSPYHALSPSATPLLAVCSTLRQRSCSQARAFTAAAQARGARASVLEQDLSHRAVNETLGAPNAYTEAVETFLGALDPAITRALRRSEGTRSLDRAR